MVPAERHVVAGVTMARGRAGAYRGGVPAANASDATAVACVIRVGRRPRVRPVVYISRWIVAIIAAAVVVIVITFTTNATTMIGIIAEALIV